MPADMSDRTDFDNANRGFMGRLSPGVIKTPDGRVVFDAEAFVTATTGNAPDTVHPSLWRQSQLTAIHGLFEVTDGIYQIRGMDLSNMTLVEGETGVIVIDPLISAECAAAGLALYREHRGDRPVTAVIYTHSHIDHFGGVLGVVDADTDVSIVAPEHFLDHSVSENVYAGGAMLRRGMYYAGAGLSIGTEGAVGIGLGSGSSSGTVGLIAPTLGSVSHNVKAIYQRYVGWYDGNPAHLWQHPPEAAGARYVEVIGGIDATVAKAEQFADQGDLRFAAELASHAVFAEPNHAAARTVLAEVLTRLGHGSENATWRNCFLSGAAEIHGAEFPPNVSAAGMAAALTTTQLFDSIAIRIDGKRAWAHTASINWTFTDTGDQYRMELSNGVLIHYPTTREQPADLTIRLTKPQLLGIVGGAGMDGVDIDGDPRALQSIMESTDAPNPAFPIVTP